MIYAGIFMTPPLPVAFFCNERATRFTSSDIENSGDYGIEKRAGAGGVFKMMIFATEY
jgi:hypothetical protein